jgi:hypothetical protein
MSHARFDEIENVLPSLDLLAILSLRLADCRARSIAILSRSGKSKPQLRFGQRCLATGMSYSIILSRDAGRNIIVWPRPDHLQTMRLGEI